MKSACTAMNVTVTFSLIVGFLCIYSMMFAGAVRKKRYDKEKEDKNVYGGINHEPDNDKEDVRWENLMMLTSIMDPDNGTNYGGNKLSGYKYGGNMQVRDDKGNEDENKYVEISYIRYGNEKEDDPGGKQIMKRSMMADYDGKDYGIKRLVRNKHEPDDDESEEEKEYGGNNYEEDDIEGEEENEYVGNKFEGDGKKRKGKKDKNGDDEGDFEYDEYGNNKHDKEKKAKEKKGSGKRGKKGDDEGDFEYDEYGNNKHDKEKKAKEKKGSGKRGKKGDDEGDFEYDEYGNNKHDKEKKAKEKKGSGKRGKKGDDEGDFEYDEYDNNKHDKEKKSKEKKGSGKRGKKGDDEGDFEYDEYDNNKHDKEKKAKEKKGSGKRGKKGDDEGDFEYDEYDNNKHDKEKKGKGKRGKKGDDEDEYGDDKKGESESKQDKNGSSEHGDDEDSKKNMKAAIEFMDKVDKKMAKLFQKSELAGYNWALNITYENEKKKEKALSKYKRYKEKKYKESIKFPWEPFKGKNDTLYRWFQLITNSMSKEKYRTKDASPSPKADPNSEIQELFSKAKMCKYKDSSKKCNMRLEPEVISIMKNSKDPDKREHYWIEYREATGKQYKHLYMKTIKRSNDEAKEYGFKNQYEFNMAVYEDMNFEKDMAKQMKKLEPFYKQVHAYVRRKLIKFYKNVPIKRDGPIPAHLLGDMHAQQWSDIYKIVQPYPKNKGVADVTKALRKKKIQPLDMFIMAEHFFTSIGMKKMTPHFWHYTMMEKPPDRDVDCHGAAFDFADGKDFRIKMCTVVDSAYLATIHHEMGHIQYFMYYAHLPFMFREGANPGFHEAIGDSITLSVLTPDYTRKIRLTNKKVRKDKESTINYLMFIALQFGVVPRYTYIIDYWRNKVYRGTIKEKDFNKKYWEYRLRFQGVCPPVRRTEEDFDIGSKFHIAFGVEYLRYFVANILQFQIHEYLCKAAGHKGPLHECNIYKKKEAGKAFKKLLKEGKSKPWKELLKKLPDKNFRNVDASSLLKYFEPLVKWLKKKNRNEKIGWKSKDPMICPGMDKKKSTRKSSDISITGTVIDAGTSEASVSEISDASIVETSAATIVETSAATIEETSAATIAETSAIPTT